MRMKMVRDRRKSSQIVEASVEIHGEQVAADLERFFIDKMEEGEAMPSFMTTLRFFQQLLAASRRRLVSVAAKHLRQLDNDDKARRERTALSDRLALKGRRLRDVLNGLYGEGGGLELAGVDRRAAQEPVDLLAQTERIIERFSVLDSEANRPELAGFQMDPAAMVSDLRPDYDELKQLVEHLNREQRRTEATMVAKDEAIAEHDGIFRLAGGALASLYRLAGHEELAQRVTPSPRRPGRTQAEVDEQANGETGPSSEPEPSEPRVAEPEVQASEPSSTAG